MRRGVVAYALCLLFVTSGLARAENEPPLSSELEAYLVSIAEDGREVILPAGEAEPGSVLEYRLVFTNLSEDPIEALAVNGPVPPNTTYLAQSAGADADARLLVSIDGGRTFEAEPVVRETRDPDGTLRRFVVSPNRYTHIRWLADDALEAKATAVYRYRVRVENL